MLCCRLENERATFQKKIQYLFEMRLDQANETTLWLKWARVYRNSYNRRIDPASITYYLYMAGGFQTIRLGDRVFCTMPPKFDVNAKTTTDENERTGLSYEPSETDNDSLDGRSELGLVSPSSNPFAFRGEVIGMQR
jgi:hypothetical protein